MSAREQAAFRAGSFDVYAHPATANGLPQFHQGDVVRTNRSTGMSFSRAPIS